MKNKNEKLNGSNGKNGSYEVVAISRIVASRNNPRKTFDGAAMEELVASVRAHGVQVPIKVRPLPKYELREPDMAERRWELRTTEPGGPMDHKYFDLEDMARTALNALTQDRQDAEFEIVFGERRWRAATAAGLASVPCVIEALSDKDAAEIQALENLQRADLSPLEEAAGYRQLLDGGMTVEQLEERLGKSRSHVYAKLALLKLSEPVKLALERNEISSSVAELLGRLPDEKRQRQALVELVGKRQSEYVDDGKSAGNYEYVPVSYRQAKSFLREKFMADLKKAHFDLEATFAEAPHQGPCADCPHRTGNCAAEYPEVASPDVCTLPECFHQKEALSAKAKLAKFAAQGLETLPLKESQSLFRYGWLSGDKYAEADARCHDDPKHRTIQEVLGKNMPAPVVALRNGAPVKIYKQAEIQEALKVAAIKGRENGRSKKDVKFEREVTDEAGRRMLPKIVAAVKASKNEKALARLLAHALENGEQLYFEAAWDALAYDKKHCALRDLPLLEMLRVTALALCFNWGDDSPPEWDYVGPGSAVAKELGLTEEAKAIEKAVRAELKAAAKEKELPQEKTEREVKAGSPAMRAKLAAAAKARWAKVKKGSAK